MRYNSFVYLISEGVKNLFKQKKSSMTSLITMICAMFLFGSFFLLGENINEILRQVQTEQGMQVFISDDASDEDIEGLKTQICALDGINTCTFKSKQEALDSLKESLKENQDLLAGYEGENNIFPASYVVTLTDLNKSNQVKEEISKMNYVDKITSSDETIETLMKIARGIKIALGVAFVILLVFAITIITNTIKLTVFARRKEISIMKYVGATNGFIRGPFLIEGILIGFFASMLTVGLLALIYRYIVGMVENSDAFIKIGISLLPFSDMAQMIIIAFLVIGIGLGVLASRISMRKYLEV